MYDTDTDLWLTNPIKACEESGISLDTFAYALNDSLQRARNLVAKKEHEKVISKLAETVPMYVDDSVSDNKNEIKDFCCMNDDCGHIKCRWNINNRKCVDSNTAMYYLDGSPLCPRKRYEQSEYKE